MWCRVLRTRWPKGSPRPQLIVWWVQQVDFCWAGPLVHLLVRSRVCPAVLLELVTVVATAACRYLCFWTDSPSVDVAPTAEAPGEA